MSNENNFPSDDELLKAIRAGGAGAEKAKQLLHEKDSGLVGSVIWEVLGVIKCDHIQGVNHESWITILEKVSTVRDPNALPAWLMTVARRKSFKHLRKVHGDKDVPLEDGGEISDEGIKSTEEEIESAELIGKIRALAKTLTPPKFAEKLSKVLGLLLDGLSFEEIALVLHETPVNVRNIYYRGLIKIKKLLRDEPGRGRGLP